MVIFLLVIRSPDYDHKLNKESDIVNLVEKITKDQIRTDLPEFRVGDTVVVGWKVIEGKRERVQDFEGIVTKIQNAGIGRNFTVRKLSSGIGVERTFLFNYDVIIVDDDELKNILRELSAKRVRAKDSVRFCSTRPNES